MLGLGLKVSFPKIGCLSRINIATKKEVGRQLVNSVGKFLYNGKVGLGKYRRANPNSWEGRCIGKLAILYNTYCKIGRRFQNKLGRMEGDEKEKHLTLGVQYLAIAGVEGDIVEFGTAAGTTACMIASAMANSPWKYMILSKKLYLFDSFEGLPFAKSPVDKGNPHVMSDVWGSGACRGLNQHQLIAKVHKAGLAKDRIKVHAGWFCDTLHKLPDDTKFAMLHIDCDFYQSTMDVLDTCLSRGFITEGAIIFFDDWNAAAASSTFGERRAWSELVKKYSVIYSDEGAYSWSAHKFIVHSYKIREGDRRK